MGLRSGSYICLMSNMFSSTVAMISLKVAGYWSGKQVGNGLSKVGTVTFGRLTSLLVPLHSYIVCMLHKFRLSAHAFYQQAVCDKICD